MGDHPVLDSAAADPSLCGQCRQLDLSMAGRDLSAERQALAELAGSLGRYTPMTDVGVRVACIGNWTRTKDKSDCPLCHILLGEREYDGSPDSSQPPQSEHDQFFYAFSGQYCFQESGMSLEHNFLVVRPDLDGDQTYGMDPVRLNDQQIHGINHKLHPDFTRRRQRYIVCQATSKRLSRSYGLEPRAISTKLDIGILKKWLQTCLASHPPCHTETRRQDFPPGMRLIDCKSSMVLDAETIEPATPPSYVALSYVWGAVFHPQIQPNRTLPAKVPQVIEDAIHVTLATGYRYLWVDQYCIDQTNSPHKIQQIKLMDRIYSNAAWTIVDGAGKDANDGLTGISRPRSEDLRPIEMKNGVKVFHWPSSSAEVLDESKWATRAWTYQEAFFSQRIVIFTTTGLYFECQSAYENEGLVRYEDLTAPEPRVTIRTRAASLFPRYSYGPLTRSLEPWRLTDGDGAPDCESAINDFWQRVQEYTCREMTFPEDSLAAFRGVLQFYVRGTQADHGGTTLSSVCGIPFSIPSPICDTSISDELSMGLCWSHAHCRTSCRRPSLPSWSWAGWMGQVYGGSDDRVESLLNEISFETVNSDKSFSRKPWYNMEGEDFFEVLVLEGNVLPYDAISRTENGHWNAFRLGPHARFDLDEDVRHEVILRGLRERTYVIIPVALLTNQTTQNVPYCSARMLLLRRNQDVFERIGLFILGSSLISFKLINLINDGKTLWDTATLRII